MTGSICGWILSKVNTVISVMFGSGVSYKSKDDDCSLHSRLHSSALARADRTSSGFKCAEGFLHPLSRSKLLQQGQDNHRELQCVLRDLARCPQSYNLIGLQQVPLYRS